MNDADFNAARSALVEARREARTVSEWPSAWRPGDLHEAYRLQAAVIEAFGPIGAWKVGAITAEQRRTMGLASPIAGPIPATRVSDAAAAPAILQLADFIAPLVECEFAFELGRDLPPRREAYSREEAAAAIAALRPAIELVDPRLPRGCGALSEMADGFNNGAFIAGPRVLDWRRLDLAKIDIVLHAIDLAGVAAELARGNGRAILDGDPFAAVVMLANAQPPGRGLRAGDVVTTGSCTGAPRLPGPGRYRAEFTGLGTVELDVGA